jgi:hypothetical protein
MSYDVRISITNLEDGEFIEAQGTFDYRWDVDSYLREYGDMFEAGDWDFEGVSCEAEEGNDA